MGSADSNARPHGTWAAVHRHLQGRPAPRAQRRHIATLKDSGIQAISPTTAAPAYIIIRATSPAYGAACALIQGPVARRSRARHQRRHQALRTPAAKSEVPSGLHVLSSSSAADPGARPRRPVAPGDEYIHCTHLNDDAWRLIRDTGGRMSLSTQIEMAIGQGLPAIGGLRSITKCSHLSSDHGARAAPGLLHRRARPSRCNTCSSFSAARATSRNLPPPCLSPRRTGSPPSSAAAPNLDSKVSSLRAGKDADIVLLAAGSHQHLAARQRAACRWWN